MYKPNNKKMLTVLISIAMIFSALAILSFAATPAYATTSGTLAANYSTLYDSEINYVLISGGSFGLSVPLYYEFGTASTWSGSGNTWLTLPTGQTTLSNAGIGLDPSTTGTYYLLVSDSSSGSSGVISFAFTVKALPTTVPYFEASATGTVTGTLPGDTSNAAQTVSVYGNDIPSTDSVTVYLATGWTVSSSPYSTPSSGAAKENTVVASQTYTGSALDATLGATFTLPTVAGGDYAFYAIDTTTGTPILVENFESITGYNTLATVAAGTQVLTFSTGTASNIQTFTVEPTIVYSVASLSGLITQVWSFTGYGFIAGDTFATSPNSNVELGSTEIYYTAATVSANGEVSFTSVSLTSPITTYGSAAWTAFTDSQGVNYLSPSTLNPIYVSTPSVNLGHLTISDVTNSGSTTQFYVGDTFEAIVYEFPASSSVTVTVNNLVLGTGTTDANGYALMTGTVPALPGASGGLPYTAYAMTSTGGTGENAYFLTFDIYSTPVNQVFNITGYTYVPDGVMVGASDYGLNPTVLYTLSESQSTASASINYVTVEVGSVYQTGEYYPAANGTLIFSFPLTYNAPSSVATGTTFDFLLTASSTTYANSGSIHMVGSLSDALFPDSASAVSSQTPGSLFSLSGLGPSNEIPSGATGPFYPTISNEYSLYIASASTPSSATLVTFSSTDTYFTSSTYSGESFVLPSSDGVWNVYINYAGTSASSAYANALDYFVVVTSTAGGTPQIFMSPTDNTVVAGTTYTYFIAYNLAASSTSETLVVNGNGYHLVTVVGTGPYGVVSTNYGYINALPAGTYQAYVSSSYTSPVAATLASLTFTVTPGTNTLPITTDINTALGTLDFYGLAPDTLYNINLGNDYLATYESSSGGAISESFGSLASYQVYVGAGDYNITIAPESAPSTTISALNIPVTVQANQDLTLSTSSQYAFPGQIVQFSASTFSLPYLFVQTTGTTLQYFAQISFNGTLVATVPASLSSGTLSGSFVNPNNAPGSYYELTITGYAQASTLSSTGGSITGGTLEQEALSGSVSDFFGLVTGNGALLTGISSSQIATLEADVSSTVSTSLTVPISQLNAAITSINGAVANLKTTVGNITTDLSTINATVASIQKGMVLVQTDLGSISTSLASLNASLTAFNGNVVMINTTLGQVQTSLASIGTQVTANGNGIATVKTDIGTVQGQITSTNGNITAIHTALGNLTATVNKVNASTTGIPTLEIFLIVIIVLVLITLVLAFMAVSAANKAARRATEEKKQ